MTALLFYDLANSPGELVDGLCNQFLRHIGTFKYNFLFQLVDIFKNAALVVYTVLQNFP